jgi:DNA invertase Pin-like site-specific DNA recombinase
MERIVYYARVSTKKDGQLTSIQAQEESLEEFIHSQDNWKFIKGYIDWGKSATTIKNRKEFQAMIDDMYKDQFDIIVIKDYDRMNRNEGDWYNFVEDLEATGVKLYIYMDKQFYDSENDDLIVGIKQILNAQHSRKLSKNLKESYRKRIAANKPHSSGRMWGYKLQKDRLVIREDEAKIIKRIFDMYVVNNYSTVSIYREIQKYVPQSILERRNISELNLSTVRNVIKNPAYKGKIAQNKTGRNYKTKKQWFKDKKEWVYIDCPPIVTEETWDKAQAIILKRSRQYNIEDKKVMYGYFSGKFALSGKIICGNCNQNMYHNNGGVKNKSKWECHIKKNKGTNVCNMSSISSKYMDEIVRDVIWEFKQIDTEYIDDLLLGLENGLLSKDTNKEIEELNKQKNELNKFREKIKKMCINDIISEDEAKKDIKEYDIRISTINKEIELLQSQFEDFNQNKNRIFTLKQEIGNLNKKEDITDETITTCIDKIIVRSAKKIDIIITGDVEVIATRENKKSPFVSNVRPHRPHKEDNIIFINKFIREYSLSINKHLVFEVNYYIAI